MRSRQVVATCSLIVSSALVLTGCGLLPTDNKDPVTSETAAPTGPRIAPDDSPVYDQSLTWRTCGDFDCASVAVPLDWTDPGGPTISIAVNRHRANDPGQRIGSLLINPGGPGGSGIDLLGPFVDEAGQRVVDAYDIIGFDPRGVGESAPVACGDGRELDDYFVNDYIIETQADLDDARDRTGEFAEACRELTGPLLENIDTVSAARDMDVIRAVLGDDQLHYLGFSYGTQLGATYAELYSERAGRIVLDGAVDFLLSSEELSRGQAEGFENALTNFITWCVQRAECKLDSNVDAARKQIGEIAIHARDEGYPSGGVTPVNGNLMVYGIVVTLYDEQTWEYLELALNEVITQDTAGAFYQLANFYLDRDGDTGKYLGNSTVAFTAISCLDTPQEEWTIAQQREFARVVEEASPTFGWWFGASAGCEGWPWTAKELVTDLSAATTAEPMLVVGTINDPATPYSWAVSLSDRLGAALLTWDGEGHTAYGRSNRCVTDAVDAYLVDGVLPTEGTTC